MPTLPVLATVVNVLPACEPLGILIWPNEPVEVDEPLTLPPNAVLFELSIVIPLPVPVVPPVQIFKLSSEWLYSTAPLYTAAPVPSPKYKAP